jgi:nucleoid-associated protein YgaU
VEIRIGSAVAATAQAGPDGAFVAFGAVGPDDGPRRLEVIARAPDGAAREAAPVFVAPPPDEEPEARATIVQARPEGVAVLQSSPRPADEPVTLDIVSYGDDGEVELGGRGEALRPLRVFANAMLIAETSVREDGGWSARPGVSLEPGLYTLRVEALGEDGAVRHVVESPFRRERPDAVEVAKGQVVIQPGDTLWRLAENLYGSGVRYTVIYEANADRIRDPDLIYPGQVFAAPPAAR